MMGCAAACTRAQDAANYGIGMSSIGKHETSGYGGRWLMEKIGLSCGAGDNTARSFSSKVWKKEQTIGRENPFQEM